MKKRGIKGNPFDASGRTHWGCGCCDRETTEEDNELADKICDLLNKRRFKT